MHDCWKKEDGTKRTACPVDGMMPRLADKWTIHVVAMLTQADGNRLRFSEIQNGIEGISRKVLATTLRSLERDGLLRRHVFPEIPPRVEYELSEVGKGMIPSMKEFMVWMAKSWPVVRQSREDYDGGRGVTKDQ